MLLAWEKFEVLPEMALLCHLEVHLLFSYTSVQRFNGESYNNLMWKIYM